MSTPECNCAVHTRERELIARAERAERERDELLAVRDSDVPRELLDELRKELAGSAGLYVRHDRLKTILDAAQSRAFWRARYSEQCSLYHDAAGERDAAVKLASSRERAAIEAAKERDECARYTVGLILAAKPLAPARGDTEMDRLISEPPARAKALLAVVEAAREIKAPCDGRSVGGYGHCCSASDRDDHETLAEAIAALDAGGPA